MTDLTRYARVQRSIEDLVDDRATRVPSFRVVHAATPREEFSRSQRTMASAVREERRPGLFVFAHHAELGLIGRLWLEASAQPRAGTLGRHQFVDLALPLDDSLSLRHALFVVRRVKGEVRWTALDLASSCGLDVPAGSSLRRFDVTGAQLLRLSDFVLLCVPTGGDVPWDPDARDPWATLRQGTATHLQPRLWKKPKEKRLRQVVGCLTTTLGDLRSERAITEGDLERGVLVGRSERCDLRLPDGDVSRVHAALLRVDGELLLVDTGSTNGLWRPGDQEVRCGRWGEGQPIFFGRECRMAWAATH